MMKTIEINGKTIGCGRPKTIVPIVEPTANGILAQAAILATAPLDFVEWRADFFDGATNPQALMDILQALHTTLSPVGLLVTYRRNVEGGEGTATLNEYQAFCETVIKSGYADLLDLELSIGTDLFAHLIDFAHTHTLPTIASSHNFKTTPTVTEMVDILCAMQSAGADIAKLAVMPNSRQDLLNLLQATTLMTEQHPQTPIVTMSMGAIGQASRVCGASFGSAMTFASIGASSAPGQIALPQMNALLDTLYCK